MIGFFIALVVLIIFLVVLFKLVQKNIENEAAYRMWEQDEYAKARETLIKNRH